MTNEKTLKTSFVVILTTLFSFGIHAQIENINIDTFSLNELKSLLSQIEIDGDEKIIALGETHDFYVENSVIQISLIEELSKRFDSLVIVLEIPFSEAFLINNYLEKNDTTIFKYADFIRSYYLYQLNSLKKLYDKVDSKFKVVGLDLGGRDFVEPTLLSINQVFQKNSISRYSELSKDFLVLVKLSENWWVRRNKNKLRKICEKIIENIGDETYYKQEKKLLQSDWLTLKKIVENYYLGSKYRDKKPWGKREEILYERMVQQIRENPKSKFYVHFGAGHTVKGGYMCECKGVEESFVTKLVKDKFEILSIVIVYNYMSKSYIFKEINWETQEYLLDKTLFGKSTLLDRIKEKSFDKKNYLITTKGTESESSYDYVLILNTILAREN